jgi:hypothetical protein
MKSEPEELIETFTFFQQACGNFDDLSSRQQQIKKALSVRSNSDIPIILTGILQIISINEPYYYWNKDVTEEIFRELSSYYTKDRQRFEKVFHESLEHFFNAFNSYDYILDFYKELHDVSFANDVKTILYRNPIYIQICENCLANFYRSLRNIIDEFSTSNYSTQETLGEIIPVLRKYNFLKSTSINVNYRNAINHGKATLDGEAITFRFKDQGVNKIESIKLYEFDYIIEDSFDIATGILVGYLKILTVYNDLLQYCLANESNEAILFEWFKFYYRSPNSKILYLNKAELDNSQLNIHLRTSIPDKSHLLMAIVQILRGVHYNFPSYKNYFIGYKHPRSLDGWVRIPKDELEGIINDLRSSRTPRSIEKGGVLIWDIQSDNIDERAFKFHTFPPITGQGWFLTNIKDCSIPDFKRIKANLIIEKRSSRKEIKKIIRQAIEKAKELYTPQNPFMEVPFGEKHANIVFLYVFYKSHKRYKFDLQPGNIYFICLANYYDSDDAPKIENGDTFKSLWEKYSKENFGKIELAWNPKAKIMV